MPRPKSLKSKPTLLSRRARRRPRKSSSVTNIITKWIARFFRGRRGWMMPITASRSALVSMRRVRLLFVGCILACAACTTVAVNGPRHIDCLDLVDGTGLLDDTPHASPPQSAASNQWVDFAVAEAGQLNKANKDKQITRQICQKVQGLNAEADKQAKKKTRRFLGVF